MKSLRSTLDHLRERYAPVKHTSTFRATGQITPEEFVAAGDFLVYKFPSWSWSDAADPSRRVNYLPDGKQFLVTRGVPCHRRLDDDGFAGTAKDVLVREGEGKEGEDEEWLQTGGNEGTRKVDERDVRTIEGSGNLGPQDEEDEIPDMEDDEDDEDAIIREKTDDGTNAPTRTYTLYITYSTFYRTPRFYLSGYTANQPLPPEAMMSDIVGDYADKTVTLEDFPFFDAATSIKMASVHPCRHASVMKTLLDRADAALKLRRDRIKAGKEVAGTERGMEGLVDEVGKMKVGDEQGHRAGVAAAGGNGGDEWEVLQHEGDDEDGESAIRVDQYLIVFMKFLATMTPSIEHDYTMGV